MTLPAFNPTRAYLNHAQRLVFRESDGLKRALHEGFFALQIPSLLDLAPLIRLAREFHLDTALRRTIRETRFRGFKQLPGIYFDRTAFQTEHILTDATQRRQTFPAVVRPLCDRMHELGRIILRTVLEQAGIAPRLWSQITGHVSDGGGIPWFAASHYRSTLKLPGAPAHKDTGFVTVLYCNQPGLEARVGGTWVDVLPVAGHFLIHFGGALELLTSCLPGKVEAVLHRVRQCPNLPGQDDRYSFAAFLNPPIDSYLYAVRTGGQSARPIVPAEQFLRDFNDRTWNDSHTEFGIST
jgi:hypothetical protein